MINSGQEIQLRLENDVINIVRYIRPNDLGIYISNDLKFGSHIKIEW